MDKTHLEVILPETIESMVNYVNRYFVDKILNKEFEILQKDRYAIDIKIDDKFKFAIWIANEEYGIRAYFNPPKYDCSFCVRFSEKERNQIYNLFIPEIAEVKGKLDETFNIVLDS